MNETPNMQGNGRIPPLPLTPPVPESSDPGSAMYPDQASAEAKLNSPRQLISSAVSMIWIYLASQLGLGLAFGLIFGLLGGLFLVLSGAAAADLISTLGTAGAAAGSALCAIAFARGRLTKDSASGLFRQIRISQVTGKDLLLGICGMYALMTPLSFAVSALSNLLFFFFGVEIPAAGESTSISLAGNLLYALFAILIAPLFEEIVFRGLIVKPLKKYSTSFAILFSALLFGFLHMNFYQGIPVVGMAIALGYMYVKTGNLAVPFLMHVINNLIAVLSSMLPGALGIVLTAVTVLFAIAGWVLIFRNWNRISGTFAGSGESKILWHDLSQTPSFWLLAAAFVIAGLFFIFGSAAF